MTAKVLQHDPRRGLRIALVTEATYPHALGGVSVWCDELIRGLEHFQFDVYAICDAPARETLWAAPSNVTSLGLVPIGVPTRQPWRRFPAGDREEFDAAFERFCLALFAPTSPSVFVDSLEQLRAAFEWVPPSVGLRMHSSVTTLSSVWSRHGVDERSSSGSPTVGDVVGALSMFDSLLRPLDIAIAPCDVVHSTANGLANLIAFGAKWDLGVPLVLTEHGVYLRERYLAEPPEGETRAVSVLRMKFFRALNSAGLHMADRLSPVTEFNARWEERTGASPERIRVIHNGVDPERFEQVSPPSGPPTVSFIGRLDPLKDLVTLIEAFALTVEEVPRARLRIFGPVQPGNEGYYERLVRLVAERGLTDKVSFEGRLEDPRIAYQSGHVVALSSISEGLPYTLIEAMMSGCATVSTDVGGVAEVVGDAGRLVSPRDPRAFADALVDLLRNPKRRRRMAGDARLRASQLFTTQRFVTAYEGLYRESVAGDADLSTDDRYDVEPDRAVGMS